MRFAFTLISAVRLQKSPKCSSWPPQLLMSLPNFCPANHLLQASTETWLQEKDRRSNGAVGLLHSTLKARTQKARNHWSVPQTDQRQQIWKLPNPPSLSQDRLLLDPPKLLPSLTTPTVAGKTDRDSTFLNATAKCTRPKARRARTKPLEAKLGVFICDSKWRPAEPVCVSIARHPPHMD